MKIIVRQAQPADAEAIADILTQAMRFKLSKDDKVWGEQPYTASELQKRIDDGLFYAAWFGNELVGTLTLQWEDEMVWGEQPSVAVYIHQLAIKDGYRGRDIGEQILDWADHQAADHGRSLLRLDVPPFNAGLRKYYEKLGFRWVGDRKVDAPHLTYTAALYERPIGLKRL